MKRRRALLLAATGVLATTTATDAFGSVTANRGLQIAVAPDDEAFLGVELALTCDDEGDGPGNGNGDEPGNDNGDGPGNGRGNEEDEPGNGDGNDSEGRTGQGDGNDTGDGPGGGDGGGHEEGRGKGHDDGETVLTVTLTDRFTGSSLDAALVSVGEVETKTLFSSSTAGAELRGVAPGDEVRVEAWGDDITVDLTRTVPACEVGPGGGDD